MRLIYLSSVRWSSFAQRPHAMVRYFLERGGEAVLWVDPYPTRLPSLSDVFRWRRDLHDQGTPLCQGIHVVRPRALPIEPIPGGGGLNRLFMWGGALKTIEKFVVPGATVLGIGRPSALATCVMQRLPSCESFYDAMDDFPAFYEGLSMASMRQRERAIAALVDRIFVASPTLERKFHFRSTVLSRLPNACDASALPMSPRKRKGHVVIGYVGTIAGWFDWSIVSRLARSMPEAEVRLIGPCFSRPDVSLPGNVTLWGPCRFEDVPRHLESFTIGLIPFKDCTLTAAVDPIKYYEYRAMGLPIASTPFGTMKQREAEAGVFLLSQASSLNTILNDALEWSSTTSEVLKFRRENDWSVRFKEVGLFDAV